eukprot:GHVT01028862.1.p1 GENE.GHVT01028862.1~~GHVT01028862.1.p1  ORF type:complete len:252 (-),score=26.56 GHVT01028862.1:462-1217(-)
MRRTLGESIGSEHTVKKHQQATTQPADTAVKSKSIADARLTCYQGYALISNTQDANARLLFSRASAGAFPSSNKRVYRHLFPRSLSFVPRLPPARAAGIKKLLLASSVLANSGNKVLVARCRLFTAPSWIAPSTQHSHPSVTCLNILTDYAASYSALHAFNLFLGPAPKAQLVLMKVVYLGVGARSTWVASRRCTCMFNRRAGRVGGVRICSLARAAQKKNGTSVGFNVHVPLAAGGDTTFVIRARLGGQR